MLRFFYHNLLVTLLLLFCFCSQQTQSQIFNNTSPQIIVFPNPISNPYLLSIHFKNTATGNYVLRLITQTGYVFWQQEEYIFNASNAQLNYDLFFLFNKYFFSDIVFLHIQNMLTNEVQSFSLLIL